MDGRYKSRKQQQRFNTGKTVLKEKQRRQAMHSPDPNTGKGVLKRRDAA